MRAIVVASLVVRSPAALIALACRHFRSWAVAQIEVAAEAGLGSQVRFAGPISIIRFDRWNRAFEPDPIVRSLVDAKYHLGQKRWLRAGQIIRPIRVQNFAVLANLVQKVVRHILGQLDLPILKQAALDEIAVPPIHLVEAAAWNDVRIR